MKRTKPLSEDDRILWNRVARSATPLKGTAPVLPDAEPVVDLQIPLDMSLAAPAQPAATPPKRQQQVVRHIDKPTYEKLSKGKLVIEATIDLHGLTQAEAHGFLLSFLHRAYTSDIRYVIVVTGKGSSAKGEGVLRRAVPEWLATPSFRSIVSSHDSAARHHGGGGALYVRLRKRTA